MEIVLTVFKSRTRSVINPGFLWVFVGMCLGLVLLILPNGASLVGAYIIVSIGSLYLFWTSFTSRVRTRAYWLRIALWMVGSILFSWSLIGFTLFFAFRHIPPQVYRVLYYIKPVIGGMGLGILLLLVISGELFRAFSPVSSEDSRRREKGV